MIVNVGDISDAQVDRVLLQRFASRLGRFKEERLDVIANQAVDEERRQLARREELER